MHVDAHAYSKMSGALHVNVLIFKDKRAEPHTNPTPLLAGPDRAWSRGFTDVGGYCEWVGGGVDVKGCIL